MIANHRDSSTILEPYMRPTIVPAKRTRPVYRWGVDSDEDHADEDEDEEDDDEEEVPGRLTLAAEHGGVPKETKAQPEPNLTTTERASSILTANREIRSMRTSWRTHFDDSPSTLADGTRIAVSIKPYYLSTVPGCWRMAAWMLAPQPCTSCSHLARHGLDDEEEIGEPVPSKLTRTGAEEVGNVERHRHTGAKIVCLIRVDGVSKSCAFCCFRHSRCEWPNGGQSASRASNGAKAVDRHKLQQPITSSSGADIAFVNDVNAQWRAAIDCVEQLVMAIDRHPDAAWRKSTQSRLRKELRKITRASQRTKSHRRFKYRYERVDEKGHVQLVEEGLEDEPEVDEEAGWTTTSTFDGK